MPRETARDHLCSRYAAVSAARARTTSRLTPRPSYKSLSSIIDSNGRLSTPTPAVQPDRRECVFMPLRPTYRKAPRTGRLGWVGCHLHRTSAGIIENLDRETVQNFRFPQRAGHVVKSTGHRRVETCLERSVQGSATHWRIGLGDCRSSR